MSCCGTCILKCFFDILSAYHIFLFKFAYFDQAVPVDGEVFQGSSTITIEHLTGETKPLERKVGDSIPGGARNLEGMMIVKVCLKFHYKLHCYIIIILILFSIA